MYNPLLASRLCSWAAHRSGYAARFQYLLKMIWCKYWRPFGKEPFETRVRYTQLLPHNLIMLETQPKVLPSLSNLPQIPSYSHDSDQFKISPEAHTRNITSHSIIWRTWLFIAYQMKVGLRLPILTVSLTFLLKRLGEYTLLLRVPWFSQYVLCSLFSVLVFTALRKESLKAMAPAAWFVCCLVVVFCVGTNCAELGKFRISFYLICLVDVRLSYSEFCFEN